jgi:hypothetical protein
MGVADMNVISLGWGIQSFTLAAMVALGELPPVDAAIHADTTHERSQTYDFARRWTPWLDGHGVKVVTVRGTSKRITPVNYVTTNTVLIPAITATPSSSGGRLRRQCTQEWKIYPIRRWLQANRNGEIVHQYLGISLDEYQRMRDSDVKYIIHHYPLVEQHITRRGCVEWLMKHHLEVPVKSSCVFCPYHNTAAWRELKASGNGDWEKAVAVDEAIRKARPPYDLFVHPARKPLVDVDLRTPQERGQMELWANWDDECSGMCGV